MQINEEFATALVNFQAIKGKKWYLTCTIEINKKNKFISLKGNKSLLVKDGLRKSKSRKDILKYHRGEFKKIMDRRASEKEELLKAKNASQSIEIDK